MWFVSWLSSSVSFCFPAQSVSALVQPLGVGAEYLNSSLVQVSLPVCPHVNTFSISPCNVIQDLSTCLLSNFVPVLKWSLVFVYMMSKLFSFAVSSYCFAAASASFSPQGLTSSHIVFPSQCSIQSSIRWSNTYRTWRKKTLKTR